jgi:ABC-type tungstate transport system permease subunit/ABC-type tungstate transport system substrate-binding protein
VRPQAGYRCLALLAGVLLLLGGCGTGSPAERSLILATTTSTQDSGLLDELLPAFTEDTGWAVQALAVGSGQALELGRRGEADVLFVHAPAAEEELVAAGVTGRRLLVMHNDFVLIGPPDDPAGIRGLPAAEAMAAIAATQSVFASRGDDSGTHGRELQLWAAAGIEPGGPWYRSTGQGMGATLRVADETGGHTLSDRATYLSQQETLRSEILTEGDSRLLNIYHVIEVATAAGERVRPEGAAAFADWVTGERAQTMIGMFGTAEFGSPLFVPDAGRTVESLGAGCCVVGQPGGAASSGSLAAAASSGSLAADVDVVLDGLAEALRLLVTGDEDTWAITALTLRVSLTATALAVLVGGPLGAAVALGRFPGRRVLLAAANTGMGLPPVVVGLFVTVLLWRSGPLGAFGLLYTPTAMVLAQAAIATPIVVALTAAALQQVDPDFGVQMQALGASRVRALGALLTEARLPLLAAAMAGFGAVVSEVGAALMVGGNLAGETRVLTTAAVLATSRGQFALAIAFGLILLGFAFVVNLCLTLAQQRHAAAAR